MCYFIYVNELIFAPNLTTNSYVFTQSDQMNESIQDKATRMSTQAASSIEANRRLKEQELYRDLTFTPSIDPLSKALGRSPDLQVHTISDSFL